MKYIKEYLKDAIKVKPLGELIVKEDELNGMSGKMVYIDGKCSDIFVSHADYANWLEKQCEQKFINYNEELKKCKENPLYFLNKYVKLENRQPTWSKDDEMIRKALIDYFEDANKSDENPLQSYGIQTYEIINWLEKTR